jgi:hypothetical protein
MSNELIVRARSAVAGTSKPDDPASSSLIARARAAIEAPSKQIMIASAPPPSIPRVEQVKIPVTCSARGQSYVVIAERRGNDLRFVGHEILPPGREGASQLPGHLSGEYRMEKTDWRCPLCQTDGAVWLCGCAEMNGAMHCRGTSGGRYRCACGKSEEREFITVPKVEVRGTSVAATPKQSSSGLGRGQLQLKQVTYDR